MASEDASFFDLFSSGTDDFLQQLDVNDVFANDILGRESGLSVLESVFSEPNLFESAMMTTSTHDARWSDPALATSPARRNSAAHQDVLPPLQPPAEFAQHPKTMGNLVTPFQPDSTRRTQSESAIQSVSPHIQAISPLSHTALPLRLTPPSLAALQESSYRTHASLASVEPRHALTGPNKRAKYQYTSSSTSAVEPREMVSSMESHSVEGTATCCGQQQQVQVIKAVKITSSTLAEMVQGGFKRYGYPSSLPLDAALTMPNRTGAVFHRYLTTAPCCFKHSLRCVPS